jgi:hypothetical protein
MARYCGAVLVATVIAIAGCEKPDDLASGGADGSGGGRDSGRRHKQAL